MLQEASEWRIVFALAAVIYCGGAVFYSLFASGKQQDWATDCDDYEHHASTPQDDDWITLTEDKRLNAGDQNMSAVCCTVSMVFFSSENVTEISRSATFRLFSLMG